MPTFVPPPTDRRPSRCRGLALAEPTPSRCPAYARRADGLANHRPDPLAPDPADDAGGRTRPATGGMRSTNGNRGVTSCRWAPVPPAAQRHPLASVITWCLLPGLPRSVGWGPVCAPPQPPAPRHYRPPHETNQSGRRPSVGSTGYDGLFSRPRACCQACRRRQQVIPEPHPIS